jgi:hypothetical protein
MSDEDVIAALTTGASLSLQTSTSAIIDVVHLAQLPTTTVSWGKTNSGKWQLGRPTPGSQNYFVIPPPIIKLSEIYPYPASGEEEFVELYNSGDEPVSLSTLTLGVDKSESALPTGQIFPGEFYLVSGDDLPKALPNKVGLVWLKDRFGSVIDQISYTKAPKGQSLVRTGAKNLIWTKDITSGEAYGRVLGVATDTEVIVAPEPAPETSATKSTATIKTSAKTSTSSSQATLQKKVLALESQLAQAAAALDQKSTTTQLAMADGGQSSEVSSQSEAMTPTPKNNTPSKAASRWWVWAILAGIVFVCAVITYIIARSETE